MGALQSKANNDHVSLQRLLETMKDVMSLSGVPAERIRYQRTCVGSHLEMPYFMNTVIIGDTDSEKPKLVLTHGYGSSSPILYNIFASLSERFTLYLFDHLCFAASDRP